MSSLWSGWGPLLNRSAENRPRLISLAEEKSQYLEWLLEEDPVRMDHVRSCCLSKMGLVKHSLRAQLWSKLLGISSSSTAATSALQKSGGDPVVKITKHEHYEQVQKDVERSMFKYTQHMTELQRQYKRNQLSRIMNTLLSKPAIEILESCDDFHRGLGDMEESGGEDQEELHSGGEDDEDNEKREEHSEEEMECNGNGSIGAKDDVEGKSNEEANGIILENENDATATDVVDIEDNDDGDTKSEEDKRANVSEANDNACNERTSLTRTSEPNSGLYYFQGFHDISTVFLLVCDEYTSGLCLEKMAQYHLRDSMATDRLEPMLKVLRLIHFIIMQRDRELAKFMQGSGTEEGHYALSWVLTWFSHVIDDLDIVARLFDAFLAAHPLLPMYLSASIVLRHREAILALPCEFSAIFGFLNTIHDQHSFDMDEIESLLQDALMLMDRYPPDKLQRISPQAALSEDSPFNQYPFEYMDGSIRPDKIKVRRRRRRGSKRNLMEQYRKKFHYQAPPQPDTRRKALRIAEGLSVTVAVLAAGIGYYYMTVMT